MQKYDQNIDQLLRNTLSAAYKPEEALNEAVIKNMKEMETEMATGTQKRRWGFAFVLAVAVLAMALPAYAWWQQYTAKETAQLLGYDLVAAAFEEEGAVIIDETVETGGFAVTLLGLVSGENLTEILGEEETNNKTYAVLAIEKEDGVMPHTSSDEYISFYATPLVKGEEPWQVNMHTLNGGSSTMVEAGIQYMMIQCDSIEMFADRGLYLAVMEGAFYNQEAFLYDKNTGEVQANANYKGVNALFELPLDPAKGDPQKARWYLEELLKEPEEPVDAFNVGEDGAIDFTFEEKEGDSRIYIKEIE